MTESGRRLAKLALDTLTTEQRTVYDLIANGRRSRGRAFAAIDAAGGLEGPFNAMLLSPDLGAALQAVGVEIRFGSTLSAREREIAILVVASVWQSEYEKNAHEAIGRRVGLTEPELQLLSSARPGLLDDEREALVGQTVLALAARADLTDEEYAAAVSQLGERAVFELSTLVGYYATLALQLRIFRVPLPGSP